LQGSTRFELSPDERSVFIDLLCLAGDDDGFIRANPETTYPEPYLAHLLNIEVELLKRAVKKCIAVGKLTLMPDGILYVNSWKDYQLDPRRKREVMEGESPRPRITSSLNTNSPNTNSSRKENLDLDDTERSAGCEPQIRRALGANEEAALDKKIVKAKEKGALLEAELERKRRKAA
jgi:hypothetical protein